MLIGRPRVVDRWTQITQERPARQKELFQYARVGVPQHLAVACDGDTDANPRFTVGGTHEPRTLDEIALMASLSFAISLFLEDGFDLRKLAPIISIIESLSIQGDDLVGFEIFSRADQLKSLRISADLPEPLNLSSLPRLELFRGRGVNAASAAHAPHLVGLDLDLAEWPEGLVIAGPVRHLGISSELEKTHEISRMPALAHPEALLGFDMRTVSVFDVSSLSAAVNLEDVRLGSCATLLHVDALAKLPNLKRVWIDGVHHMLGWKSLANLKVEQLEVQNQFVIPTAFVNQLNARSDTWRVDPKR